MPIFVTMLRGINVSGQKKIKMNELRELYTSLGFEQVKSYIQTGNVVFKTKLKDVMDIINQIHLGIKQAFGFDVPIIIRSREEMQSIFESNPYLDRDDKYLYIVYLSEAAEDFLEEEITKVLKEGEEFYIADSEIYLYLPFGASKTKLSNNFFEKKLNVKATTRNWKTSIKILEILNNIR